MLNLKKVLFFPIYLISPIICLLVIILLPLLTPFLIYRTILCKLAPYFNPKLDRIIPVQSALCGLEDLTSGRPNVNLVIAIFINGDINLEEFRRLFARKVLQKTTSSRNIQSLVYRELREYPEKFGGYLFWAPEEEFSISEHIQELKRHLDKEGLLRIIIDQVKTPFPVKKSPWNITLVKTFDQGDQTVLLFKCHHLLADGFSIFKLCHDLFEGPKVEVFCHKRARIPTWKYLLGKVLFVANILFEFFPTVIGSFDLNKWHGIFKPKMSKEISGWMSERIPLVLLKNIAKSQKVSVSSVIISGVTGGLRNFLLRRTKRIPKEFSCGLPLEAPDHPEGLKNHMTLGLISLPIGVESPGKRLHKIQKGLEQVKSRPTVPTLMFHIIRLVGALPNPIVRFFVSNRLTTVVLTTFRGPEIQATCLGHQLSHIGLAVGLLPGNSAFGFTTVSLNGSLVIVGGGDQEIIGSNDEAKELVDLILQEFEILAELRQISSEKEKV